MTIKQTVAEPLLPLRKEKTAAEAGVQALHHAARRLAEMREAGPRVKTRDLVALLLSHGARSWRATLPVAHVHIRVHTPEGKSAVRLRGLR